MREKKTRRITQDRKRQVETTKLKYGPQHYESIGAKSASFKDQNLAKRASWKRWHPERFDGEGNLLSDWEKELNVNHN